MLGVIGVRAGKNISLIDSETEIWRKVLDFFRSKIIVDSDPTIESIVERGSYCPLCAQTFEMSHEKCSCLDDDEFLLYRQNNGHKFLNSIKAISKTLVKQDGRKTLTELEMIRGLEIIFFELEVNNTLDEIEKSDILAEYIIVGISYLLNKRPLTKIEFQIVKGLESLGLRVCNQKKNFIANLSSIEERT